MPALNIVLAWRTVRKHWVIALVTAVAVFLLVAFYTLGQKKIYQATATIQFDPNPPRPLGRGVDTVVEMGTGSYWNNREYYETQYKIIQSMRVALAVVRDLNLHNDSAFLENLPPGKPGPSKAVSPEEAAEVLRERLTVDPVKESRLAIVRFTDADSQRAQRVLSVLVNTYVEQNLDDVLTSTDSAVEWLRTQLDKLKGDLESSEMALHDYKIDKNILSVAIDDQSNMLREEMKQLNEALTATRAKREEVRARRDELAKMKASEPADLPSSELLQSHTLQGLRERHDEVVREYKALLGEGKGARHPDVRAAEERVTAAKAALMAEVKNIRGALERDVDVVSRQEAGLAALFERAQKQAFELNLLEIEYNRLRRSKDNNEKLYALVLERTKEADLTRMMRVSNIRVPDPPLAQKKPVRPRVPMNLAAGLLAGVGLGVAAALGRAMLDRTLKTPDDVEQELGLPFLGLLPEISPEERQAGKRAERRGGRPRRGARGGAGSRELIVHEQPFSGAAEAARAVRTNLLFMAPDNPYRVLLITSAGPSEGKTTVVCCIATAMAQAEQRVVMVDCDLRRPRLHRVFGKSTNVGVTTALLEGKLPDEELMRTEVPNLWVLPAGPLPPNPAELFHSERFKVLLEQLTARYDRVIIDSPPIVAVTDAAILSTLAEGTVLVTRAFKTQRELARHGVRSLLDVGGKAAGVVLNAVDLDRDEYRYYHYYSYKKEGFYGQDDPRADAPADERPGDSAAAS
ncbi:Non-specific protein-tyrosine kinase [Chondromyces apiculatus DSM 436]|uniref:non-specific protein-tyrosine kinase n=1 Tax=Chondromyces apiculatus DSM 436 TaxID=1192034 RepID=A0A017T1W1_9BACT|nr:Non-specific protein-tyrosine kinase [Chondromyces apiculatus DSM 436]